MKTLYELLGVRPDASDEALKTAYRKLAKMHHPDLNPNDPDAARRFRQVAAAIAILCDAKRRAAYDQRLMRKLQRRLDRERERDRLQWPRILAISGAAGVVLGVVVVQGSVLTGAVSSTSVVASATIPEVVQTVGVSAASRPSARQERSNNEVRSLPAIVAPAPTSPVDRVSASMPPAHETTKSREADERGLNANERAALIRQAEELLASGDARTARVMMQRACRNSPSRCGSGFREQL
jgi:hypothetical protein